MTGGAMTGGTMTDDTMAKDHTEHAGSVIINGEKYPLPDQVIKNIKTVISLQADQEQKVPLQERIIGKVTAAFGRSQFLYAQLAFFSCWGIASHFAEPSLVQWGLPVMNLQNHGLDMAALLITTGVLIRQSQQDKIAERRSHLMLQINLLNEQKIAKVIELIEELRTDTPDIINRYDWEASVMQKSTDPQVVLNILQENLDHVQDPAEEAIAELQAETPAETQATRIEEPAKGHETSAQPSADSVAADPVAVEPVRQVERAARPVESASQQGAMTG